MHLTFFSVQATEKMYTINENICTRPILQETYWKAWQVENESWSHGSFCWTGVFMSLHKVLIAKDTLNKVKLCAPPSWLSHEIWLSAHARMFFYSPTRIADCDWNRSWVTDTASHSPSPKTSFPWLWSANRSHSHQSVYMQLWLNLC